MRKKIAVWRARAGMLLLALILAGWAQWAPAQDVTTVTLTSLAPDPVSRDIHVTAEFGAPLGGLTVDDFQITNAVMHAYQSSPDRSHQTISGKYTKSAAVTPEGKVVVWGLSDNGFEQGVKPPANLTGVVAVSMGMSHLLALKGDGTVVAWGDNGHGQCDVPAGLKAKAIAAGGVHSMALRPDGTVAVWGDKYNHFCDKVPTGLNEVVAVAAGWVFCLALRADGTVVSWGNDPGVPQGLDRIVAIDAYEESNCVALREDGTVFAWQKGAAADNASAHQYLQIKNVTTLARDLLLMTDGTVKSLPSYYYSYGLAIDGPKDLTNAVAIAAGIYENVALKADGSVVSWPRNSGPQQTLPPGLKARLPWLARCEFDLWPQASGPVTVQLPAGAGLGFWGAPSAAASLTRQFDQSTGELAVTIGPSEAVGRGAKWRRTGTTVWLDSGTTETGVAPGPCTVEFNDLDGWITAAETGATVRSGETVTAFSRYYQRQTGLDWLTMLGGAATDLARAIAVDPEGNLIVAGDTASPGWTRGGYDTTLTTSTQGSTVYKTDPYPYGITNSDGYVAKLSPAGQVLWSTYLGDYNRDSAQAIAVDQDGNILVTGTTDDGKWVDPQYSGYVYQGQFLVKLSPSGQRLWGKLYKDLTTTVNNGLALDPWGNIYLYGHTQKAKLAKGGYDTVFNEGGSGGSSSYQDGFLQKLSPTGETLWSTYIGGLRKDYLKAITTDDAGNAYVLGSSDDSAWVYKDSMYPGQGSGFVVKLSPTGQLLLGLPLGGAILPNVYGGLAVDAQQNIYVAAPFKLNTANMAYLAKFDASGRLQWDQLVGSDTPYVRNYSLALDPSGDLWTCGSTNSAGWVAGGYDTGFNSASTATTDGFVARLSPAGEVRWSTYLGGEGGDAVSAIAVGSNGQPYVAGYTESADWLKGVPGTLLMPGGPVLQGGFDAFVARLKVPVGALCVTLSPAEAVAAGARWRRVGTATWLASGATDPDVPAGPCRIEFIGPAGWSAPPAAVTVSAGQTATLSATYTVRNAVRMGDWLLYQ